MKNSHRRRVLSLVCLVQPPLLVDSDAPLRLAARASCCPYRASNVNEGKCRLRGVTVRASCACNVNEEREPFLLLAVRLFCAGYRPDTSCQGNANRSTCCRKIATSYRIVIVVRKNLGFVAAAAVVVCCWWNVLRKASAPILANPKQRNAHWESERHRIGHRSFIDNFAAATSDRPRRSSPGLSIAGTLLLPRLAEESTDCC